MAPKTHETCNFATCGCAVEIANLKENDKGQWEKMDKLETQQNKILSRINAALITLSIACILLVIDMYLNRGGP